MKTGTESMPVEGGESFNPGDVVERFSQSKGGWDTGWKVVKVDENEALLAKEDPTNPMKGQTLSVPLEKIRRAA